MASKIKDKQIASLGLEKLLQSGATTDKSFIKWDGANWVVSLNPSKEYGLGLIDGTDNEITSLNLTSLKNGLYSFGIGASGSPQPLDSGTLIVERSVPNHITQKVQITNETDDVEIYFRNYKVSIAEWTPWRTVVNDNNIADYIVGLPTIFNPTGGGLITNNYYLKHSGSNTGRWFEHADGSFRVGWAHVGGTTSVVYLFAKDGVIIGSGADFSTGKTTTLKTTNLTANQTIQLPNSGGNLPLRVNGVSADSLGDITIPVGTGTVTSIGVSSTDLSISGSPITSSGFFTLNLNDNVVTNAKLRQSVGLSVIGKTSAFFGNVADIVAGTDGHILRRNGATLAFGTIGDSSISDLAYSKLTGSPTIPTVGDATLTLGTSGIATGSQSFTANSSTNKTFTVNVPGTDIYADLTGTVLSILSSTGSGSTINLSTITPSLQAVTTVGASTDKRIVHIDQGIEKQSTNAATAASNSSTLTIHRPIEYSNFLPITGIPYIKLPTDSIANSNAIVIKGRFRKWNAFGTFWYATDFEITVQQTSNSLSITPVLLSNHSIDEHLPIRLIHNGSDVRVTFGNSQSITALQLIVFDYIGRDGAMPNAFGAGIMPNTTGYTIIERPSDAIVYTATEPWVNSKIISKNTTTGMQIINNPVEATTNISTGFMLLRHPSVPNNTLLDINIKVQLYGGTALGTIRVSVYKTATGTFTNLNAYVTANNVATFNNLSTLGNVKVGYHPSGDFAIAVGGAGYSWGGVGVKVSVDNITASETNGNDLVLSTGWILGFTTFALSGYTGLTNIPTELTYPTVSNLSGTYNSPTSPVPANTQVVLGAVTIIGASANDVAYITQAASALIYKVRVTATNTATIYVTNPTTSPIIQVAETLKIKIIK